MVEQADGSRKRLPDGSPIRDYYPAIIDQATFDLARLATVERNRKKSPRQRKHINLFQGLLHNALIDDDTFYLNNQRTGNKPLLMLLSKTGPLGGRAQARFNYPVFERAILKLLREVPTSVVAPTEPTPVADTLQDRFDALTTDIEAMKADLRKGYSPSITEVLREKEIEQTKVKEELKRARAEELHPLADTWQEATDLVQALEDQPDHEDARLRLRVALWRAIDDITLLIVRRGIEACCFVDVRFKSGARRAYIIWYRPPHRAGMQVRDGFWWAMSGVLAGMTLYDLRDKEEQERAEGFVALWQEDDQDKEYAGPGYIREVIPAR